MALLRGLEQEASMMCMTFHPGAHAQSVGALQSMSSCLCTKSAASISIQREQCWRTSNIVQQCNKSVWNISRAPGALHYKLQRMLQAQGLQAR
eukprot:1157065-Pelagomonas_calceolata.AAC.8